MEGNKMKTASKVQQLHYCEVCKISCAGPQTYKEHLEGQRHKKKEAQLKSGSTTTPVKRGHSIGVALRCELCDVTCTRNDAYAAHIRGSKHQKVVKLHTKLGKPIPSTDPVLIKEEQIQQMMELDGDCQPVGQNYVEDVKSSDGKAVSFHCKLCDCRFNDPNAKDMHLKGRRHRLQYKKKVDPNLIVDPKPSLKQRNTQEYCQLQKQKNHHYWNDWFLHGTRYGYDGHQDNRTLQATYPPPFGRGHVCDPMLGNYPRTLLSSSSWDDDHITQKHSEIVAKEEELYEIHHVVHIIERTLKLFLEKLTEEELHDGGGVNAEQELYEETSTNSMEEVLLKVEKANTTNVQNFDAKQEDGLSNCVNSCIRVGALAKNLLLTGDQEVDLVLICAEKPTEQLLHKVADSLTEQFQVVAPAETFEIAIKPRDAVLCVSSLEEPKIMVNITLTSLLIEMVTEPKRMLETQQCINALPAVHNVKWYQNRVTNLHPCPIIIRLLRDLCRRLPTWSKFNLWAVELLCERVISSAGEQLTPGEAFRHVLEALASGLILPGGAGLFDPCEKDPSDALVYLTRQEREDITASAQHALRLIAFRQIHKILGVEPIAQRARKRRSDSEMEESVNCETDLSKKIKKEVSNFAEDEGMSSGDANVQQFSNETPEDNGPQA